MKLDDFIIDNYVDRFMVASSELQKNKSVIPSIPVQDTNKAEPITHSFARSIAHGAIGTVVIADVVIRDLALQGLLGDSILTQGFKQSLARFSR